MLPLEVAFTLIIGSDGMCMTESDFGSGNELDEGKAGKSGSGSLICSLRCLAFRFLFGDDLRRGARSPSTAIRSACSEDRLRLCEVIEVGCVVTLSRELRCGAGFSGPAEEAIIGSTNEGINSQHVSEGLRQFQYVLPEPETNFCSTSIEERHR